MRRVILGTALVLAFSATALAQTDDEKNTARDLGMQGQQALDRGDARTAEDRFHRAVEIFDVAKAPVPPTLLLGYARGAAKAGHYIRAEEAYNRIIRAGLPPGAPAPFVKALEDAKSEITAMSAHIAHVTINVGGCDNPNVTLDGQPLPSVVLGIRKPVDPGTHEVKASAQGCKAASASFTVGDGKETSTTVTLEKETATTPTTPTTTPTASPSTPTTTTTVTTAPPTTPPPGAEGGGGGSGLKIAGFVVLGLGGAGLIAGAVTGGIALGKHGDLAKICGAGGNSCPSSAQSTIDTYNTMGTVSTVSFIVAGVALAAGLTMVLLAPSSKKSNAAFIQPYVGLGSVGAFGQF